MDQLMCETSTCLGVQEAWHLPSHKNKNFEETEAIRFSFDCIQNNEAMKLMNGWLWSAMAINEGSWVDKIWQFYEGLNISFDQNNASPLTLRVQSLIALYSHKYL